MAKRSRRNKRMQEKVDNLPGPVDLRPWRTVQPAPVAPSIPIEVIRAAVDAVMCEREN